MKTVEQKGREFFDGLREEPFHFFASSIADWCATTDERDLPDLLDYMNKQGRLYTVFMVPGAWDSDYEIRHYAPAVKGTIKLGTFDPKKTLDRKK